MIILSGLKDKVHRRLRIRLVVYLIISVLMLGVSILHIIRDGAGALIAMTGCIVGVLFGTVFSRIQKVSWDEKTSQVIAMFDGTGIILLVLYIFFEIFRNQIVARFVAGPSVIAVSSALFAGVMYGRVIGTTGKIREVFKAQGLQ